MSEYTVNLDLALQASARQIEGAESRVDWSMRQWIDDRLQEVAYQNPDGQARVRAVQDFRNRGVPMHVTRALLLGIGR